MNTLRLTGIQLRYVNKAFWRNPASAFFTFVFPLMFLVIFTALLGHYTVRIGSRTVDTSTYYVASMACFAVIGACFNNIAMAITFQREDGVSSGPTARRCPPLASWRADPARHVHLGDPRRADRGLRARGLPGHDPERIVAAPVHRGVLVGSAAFCALGAGGLARRHSPTPTPPHRSSTRSSCRWSSCPGSSSRSGTTPRPGSCGSPGCSRSGTSRSACRRASSARRSAGRRAVVAAWGVGGLLLAVRFFHWEPRQG